MRRSTNWPSRPSRSLGYGPDETRGYRPGGRQPAGRNAGNWLATSSDLVQFVSAVAGSGGRAFLGPKMTARMLEFPPSLKTGRQRPSHVGLGWDTGAPKDGPQPMAELRKLMYATFDQILGRR